MSKAHGKTSKGADSHGAGPRATGLTQDPESDEFKNFMKSLGTGAHIKMNALFPKLPDEFMAPFRLAYAIRALRAGVVIAPSTGLWLANALEQAVANPAQSAEALGIKRGRGRPKSLEDKDHFQLALDVYTLREMGLTIKDATPEHGPDAVSLVAKVRHVSPDKVALAWKMCRGLIKEIKSLSALESDALSIGKS